MAFFHALGMLDSCAAAMAVMRVGVHAGAGVSRSHIPSAGAHYGERGTGYRSNLDRRDPRRLCGMRCRFQGTVTDAQLRLGGI